MQDELKRFCRERLAPHKVPRAIEFMTELPKTGPGKIDRRQLWERPIYSSDGVLRLNETSQ